VEAVHLLLRRGADVTLVADESISALMVACIEGQGEILALLLEAGAGACPLMA
jgi:ankyrin repeat protein